MDHKGLDFFVAESGVTPFQDVYDTVSTYLQEIPVIAHFPGDFPAGGILADFGQAFFCFITVHNFPTRPITCISHGTPLWLKINYKAPVSYAA